MPISFVPTNPNIYQRNQNTPAEPHPPYVVNLTCPHCGRIGAFAPVNGAGDIQYLKKGLYTRPDNISHPNHDVKFRFGMRECQNLDCRGFVAVTTAAYTNFQPIAVSPPELLDFRTDGIPDKISSSMKEAVASHSVSAFRAAALMVRRTLELLCEEKGATGKNLKERISNLSQHAILPAALMSAADHLRILGNDAAHVEAKDYDNIDKEHAEVAIEVAKEILKAVYQHDDLVSRLTKLKKP